MEDEYEDLGEISISSANSSNIPVDIWLTEEDGYWVLSADNYMPRRSRLSGEASYKARSKDRAVLVKAVHEHWLPLYQAAVATLQALEADDRGVASLYYWDAPAKKD